MKLKQLSKKVQREVKEDDVGKRAIMVDREFDVSECDGLRQSTVKAVLEFHSDLCQALPDDFNFMVVIGEGGPWGQLVYEDGMLAMSGKPFPVPFNDDLLKNLRNVDWDEHRGEALQGTNLMDEIVETASNLPAKIHSAAKAQKEHFEAFQMFLEEAGTKKPEFAAFVQGGVEEYVVLLQENRSDLVGGLGYLLAEGRTIIATIIDGEVQTPSQVDAFVLEVIETIPPISRAKAEGRYQVAAEQMGLSDMLHL